MRAWNAAGAALLVLAGVLLARAGPAPGARLRRLAGARGCRPPGPSGAAGGAPPADRVADPALVLDLVAAAIAAGAPEPAALSVVARAVGGPDGEALRLVAHRMQLGASHDAAWTGCPESLCPLRRSLRLSATTGAPGAGLLRDSAQELRRARQRRAQQAAQRLGVRVVLPLGLCALPGFAAWGVVPVVLGLAGDVLGR